MRTPPRILAVDDVPQNLDIVQMRLQAHGYEVVTAADGEEALARVREGEPDLVLLDIMMPKLDGISVLRQLKQDAASRFIPVILLTAKSDTKDVVAGLEAGGDDYLTKPFDQAALIARVRSMLRIKALHDMVQEQAAKLAEAGRRARRMEPLAGTARGDTGWRDRANRPLRRFLAPQIAEAIASSEARQPAVDQPPSRGHGRVLRPARLHGLYRDRRARRGHDGAAASTTRPWASSSSTTRGRSSASPATAS